MDTIPQMLTRGVDHLLGRATGPLHFRVFIMPIVVTTLAVRAGLRDAREGQPAFLWSMLTKPTERQRLFRSGLKDIGGIVIVALVLDTMYQILVLRAFYVVQLLIVVIALAIVPYILIRGPITRLTRGWYQNVTAIGTVLIKGCRRRNEGKKLMAGAANQMSLQRENRPGRSKSLNWPLALRIALAIVFFVGSAAHSPAQLPKSAAPPPPQS
jgi:hypothetical protein